MKTITGYLIIAAMLVASFGHAQVITSKDIKGASALKGSAAFKPGKNIIKAAISSKAIEVDRASLSSSSPKLQLKDPCSDHKINCEPQLWNITKLPNTKDQYSIQSLANGKYLTVNPFKNSEVVLLNKLNNSPYQSWTITAAADGKYSIRLTYPATGGKETKALSSTGTGLDMQAVCNTVKCDEQLFTFYPIIMAEKPHACIALPLPAAKPTPTCNNCELGTGVNVEPLVANTSKMWKTGSTLRVRMDGGSPLVKSKVVRYANEWTRHANIRFNFINSGDAEIIVTFGDDGKSYSYIGTDCIDPGRRFLGNFTQNGTTHFGWFTDATPEDEFSRVIIHEFGHALGFEHEQSHPDAGIPWDKEAAYAFFGGPTNNWSRADVDRNVFAVSNRSQTQFSSYDRTSIMQYAVDNELTIGDFEIGWNTVLSPTDKAFAKLMYPPGTIRGNKLVVTIITGKDDVRVNSNALIFLKLNSTALPEFRKSLNNNAGWGGGSNNKIEIEMPAGVSITDIQECKLMFTSGKQFEWDTPDNWNVDGLTIDWVTADGFRTNLATRSGRPFVRFFNTGETLLFRR